MKKFILTLLLLLAATLPAGAQTAPKSDEHIHEQVEEH
jgi:hypothetical protein